MPFLYPAPSSSSLSCDADQSASPDDLTDCYDKDDTATTPLPRDTTDHATTDHATSEEEYGVLEGVVVNGGVLGGTEG